MTRWPASCAGDRRAIVPRSAASAFCCAAVGTAAGPCTSSAALAAFPGPELGLVVGARGGSGAGLDGRAGELGCPPPEAPFPPDELQPATTTIAADAAAVA